MKSYFSNLFPSQEFEKEFAQFQVYLESLDVDVTTEVLAYGSGKAVGWISQLYNEYMINK